ncbi:MAG: tetratricopeptide repeat protein [Saprospiraceae bacterium]|nr:tetratricopeptide repeat protein [Saprospiraceae bacterium]
MEQPDKYDQIERFLRDEMTPEERRAFEQQLSGDRALQDELRLHAELAETLQGEQVHRLRAVLKETDRTWQRPDDARGPGKVVGIGLRQILAIAATLALLVVSWQLFFRQDRISDREQLFAAQFEPYPMVLAQRDGQDSSTAGGLQAEAVNAYAAADYAAAAEAFTRLADSRPDQSAYLFYAAVSELAAGHPELAAPSFRELLSREDHLFAEQSRWYLALAYWKQGEYERAEELFRQIQPGQAKYEEAREMLDR